MASKAKGENMFLMDLRNENLCNRKITCVELIKLEIAIIIAIQ